MAISINSSAMPTEMAARGRPVYAPVAHLFDSGAGDAVTHPWREMVWTWQYLDSDEWTYLVTTVLAGARTRVTAAVLYDEAGAEKSYTRCRTWLPVDDGLVAGLHMNVRVRFDQLA